MFEFKSAGLLTFEEFSTEECCDRVNIGPSDFKGVLDPGTTHWVEANEQLMWSSDSSVQQSGWRICFDPSADKPEDTGNGGNDGNDGNDEHDPAAMCPEEYSNCDDECMDILNQAESLGEDEAAEVELRDLCMNTPTCLAVMECMDGYGNGQGHGSYGSYDYGSDHYGSDHYGSDTHHGGGSGESVDPYRIRNIQVVHADPTLDGQPFTVGASVKVEWETENIPTCTNIYVCSQHIDLWLVPYQNENALSVPETPNGAGHAADVCESFDLGANCKCADLPDCWSQVEISSMPWSSVSDHCPMKCFHENGGTSAQYEWIPNVGSFTIDLYGGWQGDWVIRLGTYDNNNYFEAYGTSDVFELGAEVFEFNDPYAAAYEAAMNNQVDPIDCEVVYGTLHPEMSDYLERNPDTNSDCIEVELNVQMEQWPTEHSIQFSCFTSSDWQFTYQDEMKLVKRNYCLKPGYNYQLLAKDSYGDGWNSGSYSLVKQADGSLFFADDSPIYPQLTENYSPTILITEIAKCNFFSCRSCVMDGVDDGCVWCNAKGGSSCSLPGDCSDTFFDTREQCSQNVVSQSFDMRLPKDSTGAAVTVVTEGDTISIRWTDEEVPDNLNVDLKLHAATGEVVAPIGIVQNSRGATGRDFEIPSGLERGDYYISVSLLVDTSIKSQSPTFRIKPKCFQVELRIRAEEYPEEIFWEIPESMGRIAFIATEDNNNHLTSTENPFDPIGVNSYQYSSSGEYIYSFCMDPGEYTFLAHDQYGDGWHSGYFAIQDQTPGNLRYYVGPEQPMEGATEAFTFIVSAESAEDCTVAWRQSCSECVSENCGWCESTSLCRNSAGTCPVTVNDLPNWITGSADNCLAPSFTSISVVDTNTGSLQESYSIGETLHITWESSAIGSCSDEDDYILSLCETFIEVALIHTTESGMSETVDMESSPNIGHYDFVLANAWEDDNFAIKLTFWDMSGAGVAVEIESYQFRLEFEYDSCQTATNELFFVPASMNAWSEASWSCQMTAYEALPGDWENDECPLGTPDICCDYYHWGNIPSYNACVCSWGIQANIPGQFARELFETYLIECEPYFVDFDISEWDGAGSGGDDAAYYAPTASVELHSNLPACPTPNPDSCRSLEVVAEIYDWPEESTWELVSEDCLLAYDGPWGTEDKNSQQKKEICVEEGTWTLTGYDTFGDGWNGGGKLKVLEGSKFVVVPTLVQGEETSREFVISNAKCNHNECNSCIAEEGCGFCVDNAARASCMTVEGSACGNFITSSSDQQCAAAEITMTGPLPSDIEVFQSGKNETVITWTKLNMGGSLPMSLTLVTDNYPCEETDLECTGEKEFVITDATPNSGEFEWKIPGNVPSHDNWYIRIENLNVGVRDTLGPFAFEASCVDLVFATEAGTWSSEMEWYLFSVLDHDNAIMSVHNNELYDGTTTYHYTADTAFATSCPDYYNYCRVKDDGSACLLPGEYYIAAIDTYGDGWNDGGNVRVMSGQNCIRGGANCAPLGTPLYVEGQGGILSFTVEALDDVDDSVSQCTFAPSCGVCQPMDGCGWCVNTGKCQASVGSCTAGIFVWDTPCPTNIQIRPMVDSDGNGKSDYLAGDDVRVRWIGNGFTADSSVTVSIWKGSVEDCNLEDYASILDEEGNQLYPHEFARFEKCEKVEYLFDLTTDGKMNEGPTGFPNGKLDYARFVKDNNYFAVVSSNVEDGVFGYGDYFSVDNPEIGICQGAHELVKLTHPSMLVPTNVNYDAEGVNGNKVEFFITDGSASDDYADNMDCTWSVEVPEGYNVFLSFLDVTLEQGCFDRLTVRDGPSITSPVQTYLCAGYSNPLGEVVAAPAIKSTGRHMTVNFRTDEMITSGGFEAVFTAVLAPVEVETEEDTTVVETVDVVDEEEDVEFRPSACQGSLQFDPAGSAMGNIYSGYSGLVDEYDTETDCTWEFEARNGYVMEFTFTEFKLETHVDCAYDYVTITDLGADDSCAQPYVTYCGNILPSKYISCSNRVKVEFSSDDSVTAEGFGLKYVAVESMMMSMRRKMAELPPNLLKEAERRLDDEAEEDTSHCLRNRYISAKHSLGERIAGTISDGTASSYKRGSSFESETVCEWEIEVDEGYGIKLEFESFHVEGGEIPAPCLYDNVQVFNGDEDILATLCGRKNQEDNFIYPTCSETNNCLPNFNTGPISSTLYTRTNKMKIVFQTDNSVEFAGFAANFKATNLEKIEADSKSWIYSPWGECLPEMFGSSVGRMTREVSCGPSGEKHIGFNKWQNNVGKEPYDEDKDCPMGGEMVKNPEWDESGNNDGLSEYIWTGMPAINVTCSVDASSFKWAGHYEVHNELCHPENFCCFRGKFNVVQKNADQKDGIYMSDLFGDGPLSNRKCEFHPDDNVVGELIYFPLSSDAASATNKGTFRVFGTEFESTKDTGFIEFQGQDDGISLGKCIGGDCVPKTINCVTVVIFVGIEVVIIVVLMVLHHVYKGLTSHQARNKALQAAKKNEAQTAELNDLVEKRMKRKMSLKVKSSKSLMRTSSSDNSELMDDAEFDNFEGFDLCGMQKLDRIDMRDPQDRRILQAFKRADIDDSGFIDVEELLKALLETTGKTWTLSQAQAMLDQFDDDGSGELGVEEFKMLVNSTVGGMLNVNRNKYSSEQMNEPWEKPDRQTAKEFGKSHLPKCPEGTGEEWYAKEPCIPRMLFGDKHKELMPIWGCNIDDCDYGLGISLYFKNLQNLSMMLAGAALVALPMILSNAWSQPSSMDLVLKGSYVSSESLSFCAGITDLVICGLLSLVLMLADQREKVLVAAIDANVQTPADYTIVLKSAPPIQEVSVGQWRKYFEDITKGMKRVSDDYVDEDAKFVKDGDIEDGKVVSITYCVKGVRKIYGLVEKRRALEETLFKKVRSIKKKNPDYKLPHASKKDSPSLMEKLLCGGSKILPEHLMSELDDLDKQIDWLQTQSDPLPGSRMFVTFDTEFAMETAVLESHKQKGPHGKKPCVKQSCEASDLIWENLAISIWDRRVREFLGYVMCFGLIIGCFFFLVWVNGSNFHPFASAGAIVGVNGVLKVVTVKWVKTVERPLTFSDQQFSLMTKLTAARIFNTSLLMFLTNVLINEGGTWKLNPKPTLLDSEFVAKIWSTLFADVTASLTRLVDAPRLFKRQVLAKLATPPTQKHLNDLFAPTKWDLAERYSDVIKTLFLCLFYISIMPTGLFWAAFAFAIAYWSDKYCLLRTWERPPELDYKMSIMARFVLEWTLVAHLAITYFLYTQWPFIDLKTSMVQLYTNDQKALVWFYLLGTCGAVVFFGVKQFGTASYVFISGCVGEQRCANSLIVRCMPCLKPPEQKYHLARYSQLEGYGLAAYNPHPLTEDAATFEAFHVLNDKREKVLAPKIIAFMCKSEPDEGFAVNKEATQYEETEIKKGMFDGVVGVGEANRDVEAGATGGEIVIRKVEGVAEANL